MLDPSQPPVFAPPDWLRTTENGQRTADTAAEL